jgi:hypothetical protein
VRNKTSCISQRLAVGNWIEPDNLQWWTLARNINKYTILLKAQFVLDHHHVLSRCKTINSKWMMFWGFTYRSSGLKQQVLSHKIKVNLNMLHERKIAKTDVRFDQDGLWSQSRCGTRSPHFVRSIDGIKKSGWPKRNIDRDRNDKRKSVQQIKVYWNQINIANIGNLNEKRTDFLGSSTFPCCLARFR